jgi:drug/metabolite transporter (DMT)-like permease
MKGAAPPQAADRRGAIHAALECLLAAALFGAVTPLAKPWLVSMGPVTAAGLLYLGAALAALPFAARRSQRIAHPRPGQRWRLTGAILAGGVVAPVLLMGALRAAPAASVALWLPLETPLTALLAWFWFRENASRRTAAAVAVVATAGILLAAPEGFRLAPSALLVAAACLGWAFDNNLTALVDAYTPAQTTFAKGLIAGAINLAIGGWAESSAPAPRAVAALLILGAAGYGLSLILYVRSAQQLGATRSQMVFAASPVFGLAVAAGWLGEPLTGWHAAALGLITVGFALLLTERHIHRHGHTRLHHTHSHTHDDLHHAHTHRGLPAWIRHTHPHIHAPLVHTHPHRPDLHHRHAH